MIFWIIATAIILLFGVVAFRGAPYVPTLRRSVVQALDLLDITKDDVVVDLGSGDGTLLCEVAKRGGRAVGYEINPVLVAVSWLRTVQFGSQVQVCLRDFWLTKLPPATTAVFIFLAGPHMNHLSRKLAIEMAARKTPLKVVSNGFAIPGLTPTKVTNGLYLYELAPEVKTPMPLQTRV